MFYIYPVESEFVWFHIKHDKFGLERFMNYMTQHLKAETDEMQPRQLATSWLIDEILQELMLYTIFFPSFLVFRSSWSQQEVVTNRMNE